MQKILLIILSFTLFSCKGKSQNPESGLTLPERVIGYYNQDRYDSIFYLFSKEMKEALSLEKTKEFFSQLKKDAGTIEKSDRISANGVTASYRVQFTHSILRMDISPNKYGKIDGLRFTPYNGPVLDEPVTRNKTKMILPFSGEWFVFWGGDTKEQNYHISAKAQRHAFDFVITDSLGKTFRKDGKANEDYYAFGRQLIAPCDAEVVTVTEGVKDNVPGTMNPDELTGNTVILKTANNEYLLFAHFKLNSIRVKAGEYVKKGEVLGLCGNSGNSSEPHLHFHIQNQENMTGATGMKCYFEKIRINGAEKTDYSPVKGERIKNAN